MGKRKKCRRVNMDRAVVLREIAAIFESYSAEEIY